MSGHGRECADDCVHPSHRDIRVEPAQLFEDRLSPGDWRIEWFDGDGSCEVTIFSGLKAQNRARSYAELQYGLYLP